MHTRPSPGVFWKLWPCVLESKPSLLRILLRTTRREVCRRRHQTLADQWRAAFQSGQSAAGSYAAMSFSHQKFYPLWKAWGPWAKYGLFSTLKITKLAPLASELYSSFFFFLFSKISHALIDFDGHLVRPVDTSNFILRNRNAPTCGKTNAASQSPDILLTIDWQSNYIFWLGLEKEQIGFRLSVDKRETIWKTVWKRGKKTEYTPPTSRSNKDNWWGKR